MMLEMLMIVLIVSYFYSRSKLKVLGRWKYLGFTNTTKPCVGFHRDKLLTLTLISATEF